MNTTSLLRLFTTVLAMVSVVLAVSIDSPNGRASEPPGKSTERDLVPSHKLICAVQLGENTEAIQKLLDSGIDVNARAEAGVTAYHAARLLGDVELAQYLAQHGANTNIPIPAPDQLADALFAHFILTNGPGAAVLVAQNGTVLFERG